VPVSGRLLPVLVLGSAWLVGFVLRRRQRHVVVWQGRVARLEREHEDARAAALAAERARIARELHDVVSHSVSVMVIQAGAARQVLARDPARAASVLGTVEAAGREALGELRRLLGVLGDQPEAPRAPQPGIAQLGCLIERVRAAGLPVTLRVEGVARALPAGVDLAAYRVCQEALTNALKHADRAPTEVVVRYAERELTLRVRDQGRLAPASADIAPGYGLVGMRERVALYGGTLHAGATAERGYEVRALLPLELPPG
jgi:signal transduction histidine kinase